MVGSAELFLKVSGWSSEFESVTKVLRHYKRRIGSEKTKQNVLGFLKALCYSAGKNPDELVELSVEDASKIVQAFIDGLAEKKRSIRYVNVALAYIKTFFRVNGFEGYEELKVERYFQPARYRKRPEYVPTAEEIERMAYTARSKRNKAAVLTLYTTGLRSSTLRALTVGDVVAGRFDMAESQSNNPCNDREDNDLDWHEDCRDLDCNSVLIGKTVGGDNIRCEHDGVEDGTYNGEVTCWDGYDNDHDNLVDCEDPDCNYSEYNNITACQGECGRASLVLSRDMNFDRLEDRYCQIDYEAIPCLGIAQAKSDQAEYEDQQMTEHIKHCQDDNCDCRNY